MYQVCNLIHMGQENLIQIFEIEASWTDEWQNNSQDLQLNLVGQKLILQRSNQKGKFTFKTLFNDHFEIEGTYLA